jgi:hypothetical protein
MEELLKADAEMATMSFLPHPRTMINSQFIDSSEALREFLDNAIKDYNGYFGTNFDTSSDKFQNYYRDLSLRVKNREIDLLIETKKSSHTKVMTLPYTKG